MGDVFDSERQVESMIARGRRIMASAVETYKPVAIIAAFSGGNDSVVSTHFAATEYDAQPVHCGTSIGLKASTDHVKSVCGRFGWEPWIETAKQQGMPKGFDQGSLLSGKWSEGETAYEEFVLNFGFPGPAQHFRMYQRLKERPLRVVTRALKAGHSRRSTILVVSGIRHDESSIRAGYMRDTQKEESESRVWVNPFYWNSAADFDAYREEFSLPRNPVKGRIGVSGECLCGCFAKPGEKEAIRSVDPAMGDYIDGLESRSMANGFFWGWGQGRKLPTTSYLVGDTEDTDYWPIDDEDEDKIVNTSSVVIDTTMIALPAPPESFRPMCVGCKMSAR